MRSGHSTSRPLFRTIERSWPLRTLLRRFFPLPLVIQWVGQVRNKTHLGLMFFQLHLFCLLLVCHSDCFLVIFVHLFSSFNFSLLHLHHLFSCLILHLSLSLFFFSIYFHANAHWLMSNNIDPGFSATKLTWKTLPSLPPKSPTHATLFIFSSFKLRLTTITFRLI